jgi:hypothetical protein
LKDGSATGELRGAFALPLLCGKLLDAATASGRRAWT